MEQEDDFISINWKGLMSVINSEKIRIGIVIFIFALIGVIVAKTSRKEFISEGKILPEYKKGSMSKLSGLASLAGVDIGSAEGGDAVRPDLYPDILKSTPFFLSLMEQPVMTKANKKNVFKDFYANKIEEQSWLTSFFKSPEKMEILPHNSPNYLVLSTKEDSRIKDLQKRITTSLDKKTGVLVISVKMPDPVVAASIADYSMKYLVNYVVEYKTAKAKKDLDFYESQMAKAKNKFYTNQTKKAQYSDQFEQSYIRMKSADLQRERIESDYNISSGFYKTLAQQYEQAKLKLQEETPVLKVLDPPYVPVQKSEPKSILILIGYLALGTLIAFIWALLRKGNYKQIIA